LTASTRQPPAGGPGGSLRLDGLLRELRRGERDGFVRYFQLMRSPVHDFARRLLGDETEAIAATNAAVVAAFRRVILDDEVTDLWVVTCSCALEACIDRAGISGAGSAAALAGQSEAARRGRGEPGVPGRPFEAALEALPIRRRAVLLLHDVCGLSLAQMAAVFAVSEEAAGALLFRAREGFRQAFDEHSAVSRVGTCRQAEQAAAGAVGLGLGDDALRRLHRHAAYCKPCRAAMKTWGDGPVGLAVLLEPGPLPQALAVPPVFGMPEPGDLTAAAAASVFGRGLRSLGRFLRSRAAAYVLAAACLAFAGGLILHEGRARPFFLAESVGPAIRLVVQPSAGPQQHAGPSKSPRPSSAASQAASVSLATSSPVQVASEPAVAVSSGEGAAAGSRAGRTAASSDTGSHDASVARASSAATGALASRAGRLAATRGKHHGARHDGARFRGARHRGAGHGVSERGGRHLRPDRSAHRRDHRASAPHGGYGAGDHGRAHASRASSRAMHSHGSGKHHVHEHAKRDH